MFNLFFTITLIATLFCGIAHSQTSRGIKPADDPQNFSGSTKLVVVGVSKYQNVPSLSYAHTDALAFYNYMISKEGGKIDPDNTKVLLNEKATSANIFEALNWLIDQTKEGETVIFYFAGHGDLENKTIMQNGFLLSSDSPKSVYMAGAVGVKYLQDYLSTLVQKNKARVILITDACHSGKLAGGLEGVANTATALQAQWENTIKILSSQPGELSQEGTQWNGGGGVFTYYLVKGLMGFADRNHDLKITVNEINIYLNDNIPKETNFTQNPSVNGNPSTVLALVDSISFSKIKDKDAIVTMDKSMLTQRGSDEGLKKMTDTATYNMYLKFRECIEKSYLVKAGKNHSCALDIYNEMKNNKKSDLILGTMRTSLVAALQNRYQIFLSSWIGETPTPEGFNSQIIFSELEQAFRLADTTSINYSNIKAKYLLSQAFGPASGSNKSQLIDSCLALEPDNAFALFCKAEVLRNASECEKATNLYKRAIELAPHMFWSYKGLGKCYRALKNYNEAITTFKTGIVQVPSSASLYFDIFIIYQKDLSDKENALFYLKKFDSVSVALKKPGSLLALGDIYLDIYNDTIQAMNYYNKIIEMDTAFAGVYYVLSEFYMQKGDTVKQQSYYAQGFKAELSQFNKQIRLDPENEFTYYFTAQLLARNNKVNESLKYLELAFENGLKWFDMVESDAELDNIRNTTEFKALIKKYSKK